jgi:Zn finger protein HypA/HybF involved in hydrogenase expression
VSLPVVYPRRAMAASSEPSEPTSHKRTFPCEQCGSALEFKPGSDTLHCPHCGHTQAISAGADIQEYDFRTALSRARRSSASALVPGGHTVQCEGCGAQSVVAGQASRCPFCGSPVVVETQELGEVFVPESLLPFNFDAKQAKQRYEAWVAGLWFAPNDLKKRAHQHGMDGVYLPYWTYDSSTSTRYTGQRGEYYYVTETYTDSQGKTQTRQVRHTRWYPASGTVHVEFDDVLVCGSETLPRKLIEKLEPWDLGSLRAFDAGYLSGFFAERYKIGLEDGFKIAEERMVPRIRGAIESDIGGDTQRILSMAVRHADVTFKHLLLPLWISSFKYKEKTFRFVVNARSGEVAGERPWSVAKIVLTVLLVIAVIATIAVIVKMQQR